MMIHTLTNNPLFRGITPEKLSANLEEVNFHARSYKKGEIFAFMQHALAELTRNDITVEELVQLTLETGKHGIAAMAQLDKANTSSYDTVILTAGCAKYRYNMKFLS